MALLDKHPKLKRLTPLILVAGLGASYLFTKKHMAKDHVVTYRFSQNPGEVTELAANWTSADPSNQDDVAGARFNFETGKAPREVTSKVRLRDGEYQVELTVRGPGEPREATRRVLLGDEATTVIVP